MSQHPDEEPTVDLDRCRHGLTAGEFCEACDEVDLRDGARAAAERP